MNGARRWLSLAAGLAAAAVTARLGVWQLDRARQKVEMRAQIDAQARLPPLSMAALGHDESSAAAQRYRAVRLQGRWLAAHTVYLANRPLNGRSGFVVATPLQIGERDAVLVQRGWAERDARDPRAPPPVATPQGEVVVEGRLAPWPSLLFELGRPESGAIRQNLQRQAFSSEIGLPLRPLSVQQSDAGAAASDALVRQWLAPTIDPSNNYGYAFQWFALCALIVGLTVWFQLIRPRRHARSS